MTDRAIGMNRDAVYACGAAGILILILLWYAGGYLFAFGIGVLVGLIVAYRLAMQYLTEIFDG